jgi:hypothetical protein
LFVLPHVRSRFIIVISTFCFVHKAFHILTLDCLLGKVISPGRHKIVSLQGFLMEKGQFHGFNNCLYVPIIWQIIGNMSLWSFNWCMWSWLLEIIRIIITLFKFQILYSTISKDALVSMQLYSSFRKWNIKQSCGSFRKWNKKRCFWHFFIF